MIKFSVKSNIEQTARALGGVAQKQLPFAIALSLTKTAKDVQAVEEKEIRKVFDRPKPITLNSIFTRPATKNRLEAAVYVKDFMGKGIAAAQYLAAQIEGGPRRPKRSENALRRTGILPAGHYIVPGEGVPLDQYGNVKGAFITQLISYFRSFGEQGYRANMTDKKRAALARGTKTRMGVAYFVAKSGSHLHPGIWARTQFARGSAIRPILMFVRVPSYRKRFDFFGIAERVSMERIDKNFDEAMKFAIETAR